MTISQNSTYVLEHPYTKKAVRDFMSGDTTALKFIFDLLQIDTYQEVAIGCVREYKKNKKENYPIIEQAIRDVAPPERLNIRLPIPPPAPECKVVALGVVKKSKAVSKPIITNQLLITFPSFIKKAPQLAWEA